MLLKALADHAPHVAGLPPAGYRPRALRWRILIDEQGRPLSRDAEGRPAPDDLADADNRNGILTDAPYIYRAGTKPPPMLLVDTLEFVLARPKTDTAKAAEEAVRRNDAYIELLHQWAATEPADPTAAAVLAFFTNGHHLDITVPEQAKPSDTVALQVAGQPGWPHLGQAAQECWRRTVTQRKSARAGQGYCLSCGQEGVLLDTLPEPIKAGAIPTGNTRGRDAQLVSVNKSAQGRGGRIQLTDIPLCERCGAGSAAVLNALLAEEKHRYRTADSVTVWWLKDPVPFSPLRTLREARPDQVAAVFTELDRARHPRAGRRIDPNKFYALTLSANQSRVVVRDWVEVPLERALANIAAWFDDHRIQDPRSAEPVCVPLWLMALSLGRGTGEGDSSWRYIHGSEPAYAERDLLACALQGPRHRPPDRLLQRLIQRVRADGRVDLARAALLRLLLIRRDPAERNRLMPQLNPDDDRPAVLCGRIFAVLEDIQYYALRDPRSKKGPNTTITDRFFKQAAVAPLSQLVRLRTNANGHLKRLRREAPATAVALSDRLHELFGRLPEGPPATLDLHGQGLFIVGYHQQRAATRAAQRANRTTTPEENNT
ncbi:type I-C CRISPR-associated protein Cas8c/Csd1 [Marinactinospora endophytica]